MARGRNFNHKQKGHPGAFKNNVEVEEKEKDTSMKDVADFASFEAFKNSNDNEE
jgi:hypothetical protein